MPLTNAEKQEVVENFDHLHETVGTETEVELNFAMVKIRHKVIRGNKDEK